MARKRTTRSRYTHVDRVDVYLWNQFIGAVALDPGYGFYAFRYTPEFQARGIEPAPIAMPTNLDQTFLFPDLPELTYKRLPAMLADALPDDFGNALIERWMLDRGIAREAITPLDRLAYMSTRAMGALTFKPPRGPGTKTAIAIHLGQLVGAARAPRRSSPGIPRRRRFALATSRRRKGSSTGCSSLTASDVIMSSGPPRIMVASSTPTI